MIEFDLSAKMTIVLTSVNQTRTRGRPFPKRSSFLANQFNANEILIAGGMPEDGLSADVIKYDICYERLTQVEATSTIQFTCKSKPALVYLGKVIDLVRDESYNAKLIKIE